MTTQTYTTSRGECPVQITACSNFCNTIQICAEMDKGECVYDTVSAGSFQRLLYNYIIRIQNCSANSVFLDSATLDFSTHIIVNPQNTLTEMPLDTVVSPDQVMSQIVVWKTLSLKSECGPVNLSDPFSINNDYAGGLSDRSAELFRGTNIHLPPGDCCISLVFAVDVRLDDDGVPLFKITVEPSPLCVSGHQIYGDACCDFVRSILVPGECVLQSARGTLA